jgi:hypothetical protein
VRNNERYLAFSLAVSQAFLEVSEFAYIIIIILNKKTVDDKIVDVVMHPTIIIFQYDFLTNV